MKKLLILVILVTGCFEGGLSPAGEVADAVCTAVCDACGEVDSCSDTCFGQWAIYGGGPKSECADRYLVGQACRVEHGCDDPACGDPFIDMERCAENMD